MSFLDRYLYQDRPEHDVESVPLAIPKDLFLNIPARVKVLTHSLKITLSVQTIKGDATSVLTEPVIFQNLDHLKKYVADKAEGEKKFFDEDNPRAKTMEHCMTCGRSLTSYDKTIVTQYMSLRVENTKKNELSGEVGFCSWTHIVDFLKPLTHPAHLWVTTGFTAPGIFRADAERPPYLARIIDREGKRVT